MSIVINVFGVPTDINFLTIVMGILVLIDAFYYIRKQWRDSLEHYFIAAVTVTILTVLSVILHEFGHAITAIGFGGAVIEAGISWWGAYVRILGGVTHFNPLQQVLISFAGPATNFLVAGVASYFVYLWRESLLENSIQYLAYINIRLGRLNILPVLFLDGGKMLDGVLRIVGIGEGTRLTLLAFSTAGCLIYYFFLRGKKPNLEDALETL